MIALLSLSALAAPPDARWRPLSDLELAAELARACEAARADDKPVLLEFSAPWCADCKRMADLSRAEPLATELASWHHLVVDVGRFERHDALREAFEVAAIATLVALGPPESCATPPTRWPRLASRLFEPATGAPATAESVRGWLVTARSSRNVTP